jgi:AcrR family transcriptional regulator
MRQSSAYCLMEMPALDLTDERPEPAEEQAVDVRVRLATLRCLARVGVRGTTLDDIASEAGCSRATIYRAFPGGKDVLLASVLAHEVRRALDELAEALAPARSLEDALVVAITGASRAMAGHDAFQYLLVHEPDVVLPHLSFDGIDPLLGRAVEFLGPWLERFTDPLTARDTAEWAARIVCLYADPGAPFDLTQPAETRRLITTYLLAGISPTTEQEPKR